VHLVMCKPVARGGGAEPNVDDEGEEDEVVVPAESLRRCFWSSAYECWLCSQRRNDASAIAQSQSRKARRYALRISSRRVGRVVCTKMAAKGVVG
jgi:hypothetical protein